MKKKLYRGPVIDVDPQILAWRETRYKLGIVPRPNRGGLKPRKTEAEKVLAEVKKIRGY